MRWPSCAACRGRSRPHSCRPPNSIAPSVADKITERAGKASAGRDTSPSIPRLFPAGDRPHSPYGPTPGMSNNNPLRLLVTAPAAGAKALQEPLAAGELSARLERAETLDELRAWLPKPDWQVLVAYAGASLSPAQVLLAARELAPERTVLVVADPASPDEAHSLLQAGA